MTWLEKILADKSAEIERCKQTHPVDKLLDTGRESPRGFRDRLVRDGLSVIAEIKRKSPSKGELRADIDVVQTAQGFETAGAGALSVLTDTPHFGGTLDDLKSARASVSIPVLRKDFVIDPYQLYETKAAGADAVLLIVRALGATKLIEMIALAQSLDLDVLVEVHSQEELDIALDTQAGIIGVNNRNLDSFDVDIETCLKLKASIPSGTVTVAESGIRGADDVARICKAGFNAVLIGESLMTADSPSKFLQTLTAGATC